MKAVYWIGSSLEDLKEFPDEVKSIAGYAIYLAQTGSIHPNSKPLRGYGGAGVIELVERYSGNAYRVVYANKFKGVVYVLHAFQKKSKIGIATPKQEIDLINSRLKLAAEHYDSKYKK